MMAGLWWLTYLTYLCEEPAGSLTSADLEAICLPRSPCRWRICCIAPGQALFIGIAPSGPSGVNCPEASFVHLVHAAAAATDFDKQRHPGSLTALFTNMWFILLLFFVVAIHATTLNAIQVWVRSTRSHFRSSLLSRNMHCTSSKLRLMLFRECCLACACGENSVMHELHCTILGMFPGRSFVICATATECCSANTM